MCGFLESYYVQVWVLLKERRGQIEEEGESGKKEEWKGDEMGDDESCCEYVVICGLRSL